MNLLSPIKEKLNEINDENEQISIAIEFINSLDLSKENIRNDVEDFIRDTFKKFEENQKLNSFNTITFHCAVNKLSLYRLSLNDVKVVYSNVTNPFYNPYNNSITYPIDLVTDDMLKIPHYIGSRLETVGYNICIIEHEIQHGVQEIRRDSIISGEIMPTNSDMIMDYQNAARLLADRNLKYSPNGPAKHMQAETLYWTNHDQFFSEVDADYIGSQRAYNLLQEFSPRTYEACQQPEVLHGNTTRLNRILSSAIVAKQMYDNYSEITWNHDTNVNDNPVNATHKASLIIEQVFPELDSKTLNGYFYTFPTLSIIYNKI